MRAVVMGERETRKQIFLYSLLLLAVTLVLFAMRAMGYLYLVAAVVLGGILLYMSIRLLRDQSKKWARTLFWYSNCYLAMIFAAMVVDRVIHCGQNDEHELSLGISSIGDNPCTVGCIARGFLEFT